MNANERSGQAFTYLDEGETMESKGIFECQRRELTRDEKLLERRRLHKRHKIRIHMYKMRSERRRDTEKGKRRIF